MGNIIASLISIIDYLLYGDSDENVYFEEKI